MTAANNIKFYKTSIYRSGRGDSVIGMTARALGADEYTSSSVLRRLNELKNSSVPTVVEIDGIENDYDKHEKYYNRLFAFLSFFSRRYSLVKFTVKIGNRRYLL